MIYNSLVQATSGLSVAKMRSVAYLPCASDVAAARVEQHALGHVQLSDPLRPRQTQGADLISGRTYGAPTSVAGSAPFFGRNFCGRPTCTSAV